MNPQLNDDLAKALDAHGGKLTLRHPLTGQPVVLIIGQKFDAEVRQALYDDSDLTAEEMLAAAAAANRGPEGWDAPGMDVYDGPLYRASAGRP